MAMAMATTMLSSAAPAALLTIRSSKAEGGVPLRRPSLPSLTPPPSPSPISPSPSPISPSPSPSPISPNPPLLPWLPWSSSGSAPKNCSSISKTRNLKLAPKRAASLAGFAAMKSAMADGPCLDLLLACSPEYATGADFVEQLKIILSNLGIADLD